MRAAQKISWHKQSHQRPNRTALPMKWYDAKADNPPWIQALAEVRHMGPREAAFAVLVLLPMHCRISLPCGQKIDRRIATITTPPNRLTNQRRVLQRAGAM